MALQEKYYRGTFIGFNIFKALEAGAQILLGFLLLFTTSVTRVVLFFTGRELGQDPTDFIATRVQSFLQSTPHLQLFGAIYMLGFGVLKVLLIWGLLKKRLWVYPVALWFVIVMLVLQVVKLYATHPILLVYLTILDLIFLVLTWHEYQYLKHQGSTPEAVL